MPYMYALYAVCRPSHSSTKVLAISRSVPGPLPPSASVSPSLSLSLSLPPPLPLLQSLPHIYVCRKCIRSVLLFPEGTRSESGVVQACILKSQHAGILSRKHTRALTLEDF